MFSSRVALNCSKEMDGISMEWIQTDISAWDHLPFTNNSAMFELTNAEKTRILNETTVPRFCIRLLRLLLEVLKGRVENI